MTKQPHIVIFNPDQWRGDALGHAGNPAAVTPNLDALAETDGVSFRHACLHAGFQVRVPRRNPVFHLLARTDR